MSVDVSSLIKKAAEAAKHAPEHLQEVAFNKAFDVLLAAESPGGNAEHHVQTGAQGRGSRKLREVNPSPNPASISDINRTAHPEISHNESALNNSLRLLHAAKEDLSIDGLDATTISQVLTDKFRCRVGRRTVAQALNDAGRLVNRYKEGKKVIFQIMAPGEEYLDNLRSTEEGETTDKPKRTVRRKTKRSVGGSTKSEANANTETQKPSRRKNSGPATAMSQLYDGGYFKSPRTITQIVEKLKHDLGRTFKSSELSPVLLRWLRSGKLNRAQNADGQYEYQQG